MQSNKLSERFKKINKNIEIPKDIPKIEAVPKEAKIAKATQVVAENVDLKEKLLEKVNSNPYWREFSFDKKREMIMSFLENYEVDDKEKLCESLLLSVVGFGDLQNLLDNEKVDAVYVNGTNFVYIELEGKTFNTELKLSANSLEYILNLVPKNDLQIFKTNLGKYMVNVVKPDVCETGLNITIRKIKTFDMQNLLDNGTVSREILDFLVEQIENKKRIVISGCVNSGKSTFLNALAKYCLTQKRCYVLETSEHVVSNSSCWVKFEVLNSNYEQLREIALKSNPEYIVSDLNRVDDVALLSTIRANSLDGAFANLIDFYSDLSEKSAKQKVLNNFDYIVYLENRKVVSVAELKPAKTMAQSFVVIF